MCRQAAFENMARRRADEFPRLIGEELVDRARVLPLDRLAGQNHGAAIDVAALEAGFLVGLVDELLQRLRVDHSIRQKRREHDRRAPQHLPVDDDEARRQTLIMSLQKYLGEEQMRGRAADIDADGFELDVLLAPDEGGERFSLLCRHRFAKMLVIELGVVHFVVFIIHCVPTR